MLNKFEYFEKIFTYKGAEKEFIGSRITKLKEGHKWSTYSSFSQYEPELNTINW